MALRPPALVRQRTLTVPAKPPSFSRSYLRRKPRTTAAKATAALRLARQLAREVEPKVLAGSLGTTDFFVGNYTGSLMAIAQGDGVGDRQGLRANLKRLDLKVRCASFVQSNAAFRVIVLQDKQTIAGTPPTLANLLTGTSTLAPYNPQYTNRFNVLYDQRKVLNANYVGQDMQTEFDVSLRNFQSGGLVQWTSNSGADYSKNVLWLFIVADYAQPGGLNTAFGALNEAQYSFNAMTYFTDN